MNIRCSILSLSLALGWVCVALAAPQCVVNGICEPSQYGESLENCFEDCFHLAQRHSSSECEAQPHAIDPNQLAVNDSVLPPGYPIGDDTFGRLIANQYLWRMPGANYLSAGLDLITGAPTQNKLFQYTYCGARKHTLPNLDRGLVYGLPDQLNAVNHPECDYSTETNSFSSSMEMSQSMAHESNVAGSLSASYSELGFSGSGSASFSKDSSVAAANSISSESTGVLTRTRVYCSVAQASLDRQKINFAMEFLQSIAASKNLDDLVEVIEDYGMFYYAWAELGGSLQMISSTDTSKISASSSIDVSDSQSSSFSARASGWGFSGSASSSYAASTSRSRETQSEFEAASTHTNILSKGGAPGSFGPSITGSGGDNAPMTWGSWARTVDLTPWLVKFDADLVENIFDERWFFHVCPFTPAKASISGGCSVKEAWHAAALQYLQGLDEGMPKPKNRFTLNLQYSVPHLDDASKMDTIQNLYQVQLMSGNTPVGSPHLLNGHASGKNAWSPVDQADGQVCTQDGVVNPSACGDHRTMSFDFISDTMLNPGVEIDGIRILATRPRTLKAPSILSANLNVLSWQLTSAFTNQQWTGGYLMPQEQYVLLVSGAEALSFFKQADSCIISHELVLELYLCQSLFHPIPLDHSVPFGFEVRVVTSAGIYTTAWVANAKGDLTKGIQTCDGYDGLKPTGALSISVPFDGPSDVRVFSVSLDPFNWLHAVNLTTLRTGVRLPCTGKGSVWKPYIESNHRVLISTNEHDPAVIHFYAGTALLPPVTLKKFIPPPPAEEEFGYPGSTYGRVGGSEASAAAARRGGLWWFTRG